jgi:hypothetical protein
MILSAFTITALPILVDRTVTWWNWWVSLAVWSAVSVAIAVGFVKLYPWVRQRRLSVRLSQLDSVYDRPGGTLVLTFGPSSDKPKDNLPSLVEQAKRYADPSRIILLHTEQGREEANKVRERLTSIPVIPIEISADRIDPARIIESVQDAGLEVIPRELLFEITGGTKAMSVAAYLAAAELNADACYLSQLEGKFELFRSMSADRDTAD